MSMVFITRRERFSAAHKMSRHDWSDDQNMEVFGKCANPNWHGHNYTLWVTVKGEPDAETGFVMNLIDLKHIIKEKVTNKVDHKNLNLDVDFMKDKFSSTEVLAIEIWKQLEPEVAKHNAIMHCVKIQETENNYVEYYG